MPRRKLSPKSRVAAKSSRQARWRQRISAGQNQSQQAGQFIPSVPSSYLVPARTEDQAGDRLDVPTVAGHRDIDRASRQPSLCNIEDRPFQPRQEGGSQSRSHGLGSSDGLAEPVRQAGERHSTSSWAHPSTLSPRRSRRQSSSRAQSRISDYFRVSKSASRSLTQASLARSWPSPTISTVFERVAGSPARPVRSQGVTVADDQPAATPSQLLQTHEEDSSTDDSDDDFLDIDDVLQGRADDAAAAAQLLEEEQGADPALQLGQHLLAFHGCEPDAHSQARQQHFRDRRRQTNHHSLSDLEGLMGQVPDVLGQPKPLTYSSAERSQSIEWARVFEGRHAEVDEGEEEEEEERMHVCLHRSEQAARPMLIQYDIDSLLGYAHSLAFAKQGLMVNLAPQFQANIQTNLHLFTYVTYDYGRGPRPVRVKLHRVPHYCLGYLTHQESTQVYVFFPAQWHPDKPTNFPGKRNGRAHEMLRVWTDEILLPALARHATADIGQHMPSSWRQASLNAQARFGETNTRGKGQGAYQRLHYPLQAETLGRIWHEIEQRLQEPEFALYRGAQLFFANKNTKAMYKAGTLARTWARFQAQLDYAFDFEHLDADRLWLDVGKETVCSEWCLPQDEPIPNQSPAVYLTRACCLESFYQWAHFGEPASRAKKTLYTPAMLGESYDMTVEMAAHSTKRAQGWVFYQMYNSYKEMTDVAKTKPFRSPFLSQLAWDSSVRKLIEQAGGRQLVSAAQVRESYAKSKRRLAHALAEGRTKSYGIREEHRVSLALFRRMRAGLVAQGLWEQAPVLSRGAAPRPFWEFSSTTFTTFLQYSANKYLYALERILASTGDRSISYEHCKVLSMLLDCVRYCYDTAPLSQEAGLWRDRYQAHDAGPFLQGMGLKQTIAEAGYGWFLPKVDWAQLTFLPEVALETRYNDRALYDTYRKRWTAVKDVKDDLKRLETIHGWLGLYHTNRQLRDLLLEFLCTIVVQHFRKDVFQAIKDDIRPEHREQALAGKVMLCPASLESVLIPLAGDEERYQVQPVLANRTKVRSLPQLVDLLWDSDDGHARTQWAHRSYRELHQRARQIVQVHLGAEAAQRYHDGVKRIFVLTNWVVPSVSEARFFQRGGQRQRLWMCICHQDWAGRRAGEVIPLAELWREAQDGRRQRRHYLPTMVVQENVELRPREYMRGRWTLYEEQFRQTMCAVPGESEHFGHQSAVDMPGWGAQFEEIWQHAVDHGLEE